MRLDDERDDSSGGRVEEAVGGSEADREREQDAERQLVRAVEDGERADDHEAREVGGDHHPAPRVAVGERAADEHRREQRRRCWP